MANPKSVLIDIDIRAEDIKAAQAAMANAQKTAALYLQEINKLKKEQAEANALFKVGALSAEDYAKKQVELSTAQREATKGLQESNKEYSNNKVVVDAAKGSNDQLRAQLSLMTKEYNALSKEQRETGERGAELQGQIKGITDKLKANESAIGDNRRNVGNYEGALRSVIGALGQGGGALKGFGDGMLGVADGFKVAGGGVKGFGMALMSLGLPLIIAGVTMLVNVFKSFKPVADAIEESVVAIKAAFGALISGGDIMEAVAQSRALLEVMRELEDTQKAFNLQSQQYQNDIARLIIASKDRTKTDKERLALLAEANAIEEKLHHENVARVRRLLNEEMKSFQQKTKFTDHEIKMLTETTGAYALELRDRAENVFAANEEEINSIQDKLAEVAKLEGESMVLRERLANRSNQLQDEMTKEAEAAATKQAEAANKIAEAKAKALEKERADAEANAQKMREIAEEFTKERMNDLDRRTLEAGQRAVVLRQAGVEEVEIQKYLSDQLVSINRDEQAAILEGKLEAIEAYAVKARDKVTAEIEDERIRAAALLAIDIDLLEARKYVIEQGIEQYAASLDTLGIEDAERSAQLILDKETVDAQLVDLERQKSDMIIAETERVAEIQKQKTDEVLQVSNAGLSTLGSVLGGFAGLIQNNIKNMEDQAKAAGKTEAQISAITLKERKKLRDVQIAMAVIQMLQGALNAYTSALTIPPPAGPIIGAVSAAAALAFGGAQIAQMSSQKLADGGVLVGADHGHGGIPVTVDGRPGYEAEGGEIVLTKGVFADPHLRQKASELNVAGGGVPIVARSGKFAVGGALGGSASFAARSASASAGLSQEQIATAMANAVANIPAPVVRVTDINRVSGDASRVRVASELR